MDLLLCNIYGTVFSGEASLDGRNKRSILRKIGSCSSLDSFHFNTMLLRQA
jgi:hypothetical protein